MSFALSYSNLNLDGSAGLSDEFFSEGLGVTGIGGIPGTFIGFPTELTSGDYDIDLNMRDFTFDVTVPLWAKVHEGQLGAPASWSFGPASFGTGELILPPSVSQTSLIGGIRFGSLDQDETTFMETYTPAFAGNGGATIEYQTNIDGRYFGAYGGINYSRTFFREPGALTTFSLAGTLGLNRYTFDIDEMVDAFGLGGALNYVNEESYEHDDTLLTAGLTASVDWKKDNLNYGVFATLEIGAVPELERHLPDSDTFGALDPEYDLKAGLSRRIGAYISYRF